MQGVQNFGDFGIELRIKMMTKPGEQFVIRRKAYVAIKKAFEENGIKIPFPTVMVREGELAAAAAAHLQSAWRRSRRSPDRGSVIGGGPASGRLDGSGHPARRHSWRSSRWSRLPNGDFPKRDRVRAARASAGGSISASWCSTSIAQRLTVGAAAFADRNLCRRAWLGTVQLAGWPSWIEGLLAFLMLDFAIYLQHVMSHALPLLWRLHQVHHADLDVDLTTGIRFHPSRSSFRRSTRQLWSPRSASTRGSSSCSRPA